MLYAVSWSGGKDCCLALRIAQIAGHSNIALFSMIDELGFSRSNGVHQEVLAAQAIALALPIIYVKTSWDDYENNIFNAISNLKIRYDIAGVVFGDISGDNHRLFVENICKKAGVIACLPLWGMSCEKVRDMIIATGIESKLSVINKSYSITYLIGSDYNRLDFNFLKEAGVDICGERGEFHSVVFAAPFFRQSILLEQVAIHNLKQVMLCEFAIATK